MPDSERFWLLDAANNANRLNEVQEAAGIPIVGLVDEAVGGVVAYVAESVADDLLSVLNRGLGAAGEEDERP